MSSRSSTRFNGLMMATIGAIGVIATINANVFAAEAPTAETLNCQYIDDMYQQAESYKKVTDIVAKKGGSVLVPVGHFTQYVDGNVGTMLLERRMQRLAVAAQENNCGNAFQSVRSTVQPYTEAEVAFGLITP